MPEASSNDSPSTLDRQRRVFALFGEVILLSDPERDAVLQAEDVELAEEVRALLAAESGTSGLIASEGLAGHLAEAELLLQEGQVLGPYRVLEAIGAGGMGSVYLAEQQEPVRRRVALKILHYRLHGPEAVQRFVSERDAMGRLDHPNMAKILDAGTTDSGTPYLAMELIEGAPIVRYCDSKALSIEARLRLFVDVCLGVDHAHQKLLLHRDIKPSNILVANVDGKAMPKLIDFGIVKGLDGSLVEDLQLTGGRVLGTPLYMSPEALGLEGGLDTRSDVFSLGVVLYELLAGRLPWDADGGLARLIQRRISEEPPAPATLLGSLPVSERRRLGELRNASTSTWFHRLRGDLDAIVSKATAHRPEDRYGSARDLSEDIERYLSHRPVQARRSGRLYLLRKVIRRHRAAAAVILALMLGSVGTTVGLLEARKQAREALDSRDETEQLSELLIGLLQDAGPGRGAAGLSPEELLERGARLIESELDSRPKRRAELQAVLGRIYTSWELLDESEPLLLAAVDTYQREKDSAFGLMRALSSLSWLYYRQERYEEGRRVGEQALALAAGIGQAESMRGGTLIHAYLGHIAQQLDDFEAAENHLLGALDQYDRDTHARPGTLVLIYTGLGKLERARRDFEGAAYYYRKAIAVLEATFGPDHYRTAFTLGALGKTYYRLRDLEDAERTLVRALTIIEATFGPDSPLLIAGLISLGNTHRRLGRLGEAEETYRRALDLLGEHRPTSRDVPVIHQNLGHMLAFMLDQPQPEQGRRHLLQALTLKEEQSGKESKKLVTTLSSLGSLELKEGRAKQAEAYFRRVLAIQSAVSYPNPAMTAQAWLELGRSLHRQNRLDEAREALNKALAGYDELERGEAVAAVQAALEELNVPSAQ